MSEGLLGILLMVVGSAPGVAGVLAAGDVARRGRAVPEAAARAWVRLGYLYLVIFVLAVMVLSRRVETPVAIIAAAWMGLPALVSILGLFSFDEAQRKAAAAGPDPAELAVAAEQRRGELKLLCGGLANLLHRTTGFQEDLRARGEMAARARQMTTLENLGNRLRAQMQRGAELEARLTLQLRRLGRAAEESGEALDLAEARRNHDELEAGLAAMRQSAEALRTEVGAELERLRWLH
jgi:hypothetical protein